MRRRVPGGGGCAHPIEDRHPLIAPHRDLSCPRLRIKSMVCSIGLPRWGKPSGLGQIGAAFEYGDIRAAVFVSRLDPQQR